MARVTRTFGGGAIGIVAVIFETERMLLFAGFVEINKAFESTQKFPKFLEI